MSRFVPVVVVLLLWSPSSVRRCVILARSPPVRTPSTSRCPEGACRQSTRTFARARATRSVVTGTSRLSRDAGRRARRGAQHACWPTRPICRRSGGVSRPRAASRRGAAADCCGLISRRCTAQVSPRTAARRLSALRQFYRFLLREGVRADDPTALLERPGRRAAAEIPERGGGGRAAGRRRSAAAREAQRRGRALEILYATGLRVSELLGAAARAAGRASGVADRARQGRQGADGAAARPGAPGRRRRCRRRRRRAAWLFPVAPARAMTRQGFAQLLKEVALQPGSTRRGCQPARAAPRLRQPLLDGGADLRSVQSCSATPTSRRRRSTPMCSTRAAARAGRGCTPAVAPLARRG